MVNDLRMNGQLDARGVMRTTSDAIAADVMANPTAYPAIVTQNEVARMDVLNALAAAYAEHKFFADLNERTIAWLERHLDRPTSMVTDAPFDTVIATETYDVLGRRIDPGTTDLYFEVTRYASGRVHTTGRQVYRVYYTR
jgi:hypothetical protein